MRVSLPRSRDLRLVCVALSIFLLGIGVIHAAPTPSELRQSLTPAYHQLQNDPTFLSLRAATVGHESERAMVEPYLQYLPMSPKELMEIDMNQRRYEHMIPPFIIVWHERWMAMHESLARQHYGDAVVDEVFARTAVDGAKQEGVAAKGGVADTNRNPGATLPDPPTGYQGEIQIAVNHNNTNQMVAAANTFDTIPGLCVPSTQAVVYSTDGGTTWGYTCAPGPSAYTGLTCAGSTFGSDPAVYWNDQNEVFLEYLLLCNSGGTQFAVVVARSADSGATWSAQGIIKNSWGLGLVEDKQFYLIDNDSGSPFYGRHYTCWDRGNNEKFAYSTDNGATWTEVNLPNVSGFQLGCEMAVNDDGTVYVIYDSLTCGGSCTNEIMYFSKSTDGGVTWSAAQNIQDFNLVGFSGANFPDAQNNRGVNPFGAIEVDNSGGPCDGTLYVTFSDWTSGGVNNTDVWTIRSTDDGATWSAPLKLNDDGLAGLPQFHPVLEMDQQNGFPVFAWHDTRNDPQGDEVDYFAARSLDCGASIETNIQVSQPSSEFTNAGISFSNEFTGDNPLANANQYGEYMGIDVEGGSAYIAWTDTRHYFPVFNGQRENIGFAKVDFAIFADGFESGDTSAWSVTVP